MLRRKSQGLNAKVNARTIGVISDTHGLMRPEALEAMQGSEIIIHAGDVGTPDIIDALERIAPVYAVRGNIDRADWANRLPLSEAVAFHGVDCYVLHNVNELDLAPEAAGFAAVIAGHSHQPKTEHKEGVLYFNPGSAGPRRFRLPVAVGRLTLVEGKLHGEIIELDVAPPKRK